MNLNNIPRRLQQGRESEVLTDVRYRSSARLSAGGTRCVHAHAQVRCLNGT